MHPLTRTMCTVIRRYSDLRSLPSFEERFDYLKLHGAVGRETFGFDRYLNQMFYQSREWRTLRNDIIVRDNGCDLGVEDYEIYDKVYIHHLNPMTVEDLVHRSDSILDPENLISVTHTTHNAIHYGNADSLKLRYRDRVPGDTDLWRRRTA